MHSFFQKKINFTPIKTCQKAEIRNVRLEMKTGLFKKDGNMIIFIYVKGKAVCLIFLDSVSNLKDFNIKRHYETKHQEQYIFLTGQIRIDNVDGYFKKLIIF
jgi:predicted secreted protein